MINILCKRDPGISPFYSEKRDDGFNNTSFTLFKTPFIQNFFGKKLIFCFFDYLNSDLGLHQEAKMNDELTLSTGATA